MPAVTTEYTVTEAVLRAVQQYVEAHDGPTCVALGTIGICESHIRQWRNGRLPSGRTINSLASRLGLRLTTSHEKTDS